MPGDSGPVDRKVFDSHMDIIDRSMCDTLDQELVRRKPLQLSRGLATTRSQLDEAIRSSAT
jgi:hypothetical protein